MAATKGNSSERILDAAEHLFAEKGIASTSTRDIAAKSGDGLGTINYHFASKANLVAQVLKRRFDDLDRVRTKAYAEMRARKGEAAPEIEDIVETMVVPYLELSFFGGPGWRNYTLLTGRLAYRGDPLLSELRSRYPEPYFSWFKAALPSSSERLVKTAFDLLSASIMGACSWYHRDAKLEPGMNRRSVSAYLIPNIVVYAVNGIKALVAAEQSQD